MDSGNGGSLQSSSGGEDEFDSRGGGSIDSSPLSAVLRPPPPSMSTGAFSLQGSLYGLQELASAEPTQQQAGLWSGAPGSFTTGAAGASSSSSPRVSGADQGSRQQADTSATAQAPAQQSPPPRGSRKRTRASRRAPTTVLTTDTSNFRAMVQEFTGIPSPPFAAGVGAPAAGLRTRFDHFFPPPSSLRSSAGDAASLPPYLLRPFAQKLSSPPSSFPPFTSSSSLSSTLSSSIGVANANAATGAAATTAGASSNPTAHAAAAGGAGDTFQLTPSALLRLQDPSSYLSYQSLLDSQSSSPSIFGAASGFAQAPRLHDPAPSPSEFLAGIGSGNLGLIHSGLMGSERLHLHSGSNIQHGDDELSGVVASGGSCKLNYSTHAGASTSSSAAASGDIPPDAPAPGTSRPAR